MNISCLFLYGIVHLNWHDVFFVFFWCPKHRRIADTPGLRRQKSTCRCCSLSCKKKKLNRMLYIDKDSYFVQVKHMFVCVSTANQQILIWRFDLDRCRELASEPGWFGVLLVLLACVLHRDGFTHNDHNATGSYWCKLPQTIFCMRRESWSKRVCFSSPTNRFGCWDLFGSDFRSFQAPMRESQYVYPTVSETDIGIVFDKLCMHYTV